MLPEKCHLELQCDPPQLSKTTRLFQDLVEPINYGLQRPPLQMDTCSPLDRTPVSSLECEDSWKRAKEDWYTTRFSYGLPDPFAGPSCPPSSPGLTWNPQDLQPPGTTSGKRTPELVTPLNGDAPCPPEGIRKPIGNQYVGVPKEEILNLSQQTCTFDLIIRSVEFAQIMYNLLAERLSAR